VFCGVPFSIQFAHVLSERDTRRSRCADTDQRIGDPAIRRLYLRDLEPVEAEALNQKPITHAGYSYSRWDE